MPTVAVLHGVNHAVQRLGSEVSGGRGGEEYGDVRESDAVLSGASGDLNGQQRKSGPEGWRPRSVLGDGCVTCHLKSGRGWRDVAIKHRDVVGMRKAVRRIVEIAAAVL